jgi:ABC-2 type transport system ATP-binding protein
LPKKGEVEDALGKVDGVKKLSELPTDERAHAYELVSEQGVDLRPEVFKLIVEKGWVLLELHRDAQTLEDVFRSLTIGDERRNRSLAAAAERDDQDGQADDEGEDEEDDEDDEDADVGGSRDADQKVAKDHRG